MKNATRAGTALAAAALLLLVPAASAFESRGGQVLTIGADEVVADDLYVAAQTFVLEGEVQGDLVVVAQTIEIRGTVEGDLLGFAQSVHISGHVADDVRVGVMDLTVSPSAVIGGDVVAAGLSLDTQPGAQIGGVLFAGAQARLDGTIQGDAHVHAEGLEVRGRIEGDLLASVGRPGSGPPFPPGAFVPNAPPIPSVPSGLTLTDAAFVGGKLDYQSVAPGAISPLAHVGKLHFEAIQEIEAPARPKPPTSVRIALSGLRDFVALALVGLLAVWLAPAWLERGVDALQKRPGPSLGRGFLVLAAAALACFTLVVGTIILAIVFGTLTLGNLVGTTIVLGVLGFFAVIVLVGVTCAYGAQIIAGLFGGRWIMNRFGSSAARGRVWPLLLGLVLLVVISATPVIGGLIAFAVMLLGLGALWLALTDSSGRAPLAVPAPVAPLPTRRPATKPIRPARKSPTRRRTARRG